LKPIPITKAVHTMTEQIKLSIPAERFEQSYSELVKEFEDYSESYVPFIIGEERNDYSQFLVKLDQYRKGIDIPSDFVSHSTFFLTLDNSVLGVVNIRHTLTPSLLRHGGHVGYGIRPTERGNGYSHLILREALIKSKCMGIKRVLVTCDKSNVRSAKSIISNGGVLESEEYIEEAEDIVQRYWIDN